MLPGCSCAHHTAGSRPGSLYMDSVLAGFHQGNPDRLAATFIYHRHAGSIVLGCDVPEELRGALQGPFYAQYPDCKLEPAPFASAPMPSDTHCWYCDVTLEHDLFPHKRYGQFEDGANRTIADPMTAVLITLSADRAAFQSRIEITVRPLRSRQRRRAEHVLHRLAGPFFRRHPRLTRLYAALALSGHLRTRLLAWLLGHVAGRHGGTDHGRALTTSPSFRHEREEELQAAADKLSHHLFEVHIRLLVFGPRTGRTEAHGRLREMAGSFGQFSASKPRVLPRFPPPSRASPSTPRSSSTLSPVHRGTRDHLSSAHRRRQASDAREDHEQGVRATGHSSSCHPKEFHRRAGGCDLSFRPRAISGSFPRIDVATLRSSARRVSANPRSSIICS